MKEESLPKKLLDEQLRSYTTNRWTSYLSVALLSPLLMVGLYTKTSSASPLVMLGGAALASSTIYLWEKYMMIPAIYWLQKKLYEKEDKKE